MREKIAEDISQSCAREKIAEDISQGCPFVAATYDAARKTLTVAWEGWTQETGGERAGVAAAIQIAHDMLQSHPADRREQ